MLACTGLSGCSNDNTIKVKLNAKKPVTITVWHYYNGILKNAFDSMISDFNETTGLEKGIIVEGFSYGDVNQLETAVKASANMEVGSEDMPNIFASYADTAFSVEQMGLLANLDDYFSKADQEKYIPSYIEEGRIGSQGELNIFPIAKSTEIFMLNQTDWEPFSNETGVTYDDLKTKEDLVIAAEKYYNWTDAKTPDILNDGKAFYGRDAVANLFVIACKEFGVELFEVKNQQVTLNVDTEIMRKVWDTFYIPYINGYFSHFGRFRSDDVKIGEIIALTGSTSSVSYFPTEVTSESEIYPINAIVLPEPIFEGGNNVSIQQGAGMVVSKSTKEEEYASVVFLKWFTDVETNIEFSAISGYLPVKIEANDTNVYFDIAAKNNITSNQITNESIKIAFDTAQNSEFYTYKAFAGGSAARKVLEYNLSDKAAADREEVVKAMESGVSKQDAVAVYDNDENFNAWLENFKAALNAAVE